MDGFQMLRSLSIVSRNNFRSRQIATTVPRQDKRQVVLKMENFPCEIIRNFCIIAHIDHGKSTLADRLLELTGTIKTECYAKNEQVLDRLKVERDRGITVKAQTVSMVYDFNGKNHLLNLIDTPGHVDFSWEVSRSLAACQGAILLVDATQGIQAQSISVFQNAKQRGLSIVPVLNKIDLSAAQPRRIAMEMTSVFGINPNNILHISAKTGEGVQSIFDAIINRIPPPSGNMTAPFKGFVFDSFYDRYRGVITLVNVQQGLLRKGDKFASCHTRKKYEVTEVGVMHPEEIPTESLRTGQVGYVACNMKQSSEAHIGDTFHRIGEVTEPLPGFKSAKPMVFAGIFPANSNEFPKLEESIKRLVLTDRSVTVQGESSAALGQGCRVGFLGTLHMDVFRQRLEDEHDTRVIITLPTVPYKVVYRTGKEQFISNPAEFPDVGNAASKIKEIQEPVVEASIIAPEEYLGNIMDLCYSHRAENLEHRHLDSSSVSERIMLTCILPLNEIMTNFFDQLKSRSSGFASFDYDDVGYKRSDLSKMTFLLNGKPIEGLAIVVHASSKDRIAREWVMKLYGEVPKQLFEVPIQAVIGHKVLARKTLSAHRANVTAGLYGGHYERKMKHLENQKEGKRMMKKIGTVNLPQEAYVNILSK